MSPYEAYRLYLAVRLHFEDERYDYFKFNGKTSATEKSFNRRRDQYQYAKLARFSNPLHHLVANAIDSKIQWIGDLIKPEADQIRLQWEKRVESLTYRFKEDLKRIDKTCDVFRVGRGNHPTLLKKYLHKQISIETLVILNDFIPFVKIWDEKIDEPYLWPPISLKIKKYRPFLTFDRDSMKKLVLEHFSS